MKVRKVYRLVMGEAPKSVRLPAQAERKLMRVTPARPTVAAGVVARALNMAPCRSMHHQPAASRFVGGWLPQFPNSANSGLFFLCQFDRLESVR